MEELSQIFATSSSPPVINLFPDMSNEQQNTADSTIFKRNFYLAIIDANGIAVYRISLF